jgi:hypothetical protein
MPLLYLASFVDSLVFVLSRLLASEASEGELLGGSEETYEVEDVSREYPSVYLIY